MSDRHATYFTVITTMISYALLIAFGHLRDFLDKISSKFFNLQNDVSTAPGYAPLLSDFSGFYVRRMYMRVKDCWNRPTTGPAGSHVAVVERFTDDYNKTFRLSGAVQDCVNVSSYNYAGFSDPASPCQAKALEALERYGASSCSSAVSLGYTASHKALEEIVADFTGKDAAMVFGMGFATNSLGLPALMGKGSLIISDALNHTSIVVGARSSGAKIRVFKHNSAQDLEAVIREAIAEGQPRTHRPWTKIMIVVEGIYSMEGEFCNLKEIIAIKKKYKCYLYLDEAHSIGATGKTGRGCVEFCGCDPKDVDIMMGTFTKSFGSVGGYIAGDRDLIRFLRAHSAGTVYADTLAPACTEQAYQALRIIMGRDGTDAGARKIAQLRENSNYVRKTLTERGFVTLGDDGSPIVPIMIYNPAKVPAFSREALARGVAVVVVGFPATPLLEARCRVCLSAAHSRADLDKALDVITELGDKCGFRYRKDKVLAGAASKKKKAE